MLLLIMVLLGQEVGFVGVYDTVSGIYEEFDLGVEGKNPAHIKVVDGGVVTVNNTDGLQVCQELTW